MCCYDTYVLLYRTRDIVKAFQLHTICTYRTIHVTGYSRRWASVVCNLFKLTGESQVPV